MSVSLVMPSAAAFTGSSLHHGSSFDRGSASITATAATASSGRHASPSQRALALPEILSTILSFVRAVGRTSDLRSCALVNSRWYCEAVGFLWSHPGEATSATVPQLLRGVADAGMRQLYASAIRSGTFSAFWTWDKEHVHMSQAVLPGLRFDRLRDVTVHVRPFDDVLPAIHGAGAVERVTIQSQYWDYSDGSYFQYVERDCMGRILERLPEMFPNLETVVFKGNAEALRQHLDRLASRLPSLRQIDTTELWIIEG
ncbi:hypothetical protein KEM52_001905 [Ascosphaera acerosa]|nr:hypothetical protein KEM52_001905 [Ascosphaera acerosa]